MKILITGGKGQLGWELARQGAALGHQMTITDVEELDITDRAAVVAMIRETGVELVVNGAAYTAVDRAESDSELAYAVNRDGSGVLAEACSETGLPFVHVSTDYVFDGTKEGAYTEADPVTPLGVYGKSKEAGEALVREHLRRHIILRTAWFYGVHGNNFVKTMLRLGRERENLGVVADQKGCPTFAADLAGAILSIAEKIRDKEEIPWGTYHYCGGGETTWHGFAEKIFELSKGKTPLAIKAVAAITTEEYPTPARRPANSVMDCSLIGEKLGIRTRPWEESLEEMLGRLWIENPEEI